MIANKFDYDEQGYPRTNSEKSLLQQIEYLEAENKRLKFRLDDALNRIANRDNQFLGQHADNDEFSV